MNHVIRKFSKAHFFNYDKQGQDWYVKVGKEQSPIALTTRKAVESSAPKLKFINYNKILVGPLKIINNGHTVVMPIPVVTDGHQPAVCGCKLDCIYKAVQLHFHWGSPKSKGSEHTINSCRYDAELHILHQNCSYPIQRDAILAKDGFVVLALMFRSVPHTKRDSRIYNILFNELKNIRDAKQTRLIEGNFCLRDFLNGMEREEFFTYKGSLTTPPCAEVVNWFVVANPVDVAKNHLKNFWSLKDDRGCPLLNNYRQTQDLNQRPVYYRHKMN
ncbi:hypothetical protein KR093_003996, partial [Drosophila rubida]